MGTVHEFRQSVHDFAQREVAPLAAEIDLANAFPDALWRKLGEAGLLGITVPTAYGGRGLSYHAHLIAMEELSRASASVGLSYAAHSNLCVDNLYRHGNEEQRLRYLPSLCRGERVGGLAMSEAQAGSDIIGSMACQAQEKPQHWIANGSKKWITNGPEADLLIVYMRTSDPDTPPTKLSAFLIETDVAGFSRSPRTNKLGMRGSNTCELFFDNYHIPPQQLLGEADNGAAMLMAGLDSERLVLSGGPLGIMQAALDLTQPHVCQRQQFGQPIGHFQLVQAKLADMYTRLQAARAYAYHIAEQFDGQRHWRKDCAGCFLFASEAAVNASLETIQLLGARGYMNESSASRLLRDAKLYDIGGGTNEMRRIVIGRELFNEAKAREADGPHH